MASKRSAGLILHRRNAAGEIEVLLVHPGGPFWARKDEHSWSIPKGEFAEGEDAETVALREFEEELGSPPPAGSRVFLGEFGEPSRKKISAWALEADFDATHVTSNTFELEWPPRSGRVQEFPEVDKAAWWMIDEARAKLHKGQAPLLGSAGQGPRRWPGRERLREPEPEHVRQQRKRGWRCGLASTLGPPLTWPRDACKPTSWCCPRPLAPDFITFAERNPKTLPHRGGHRACGTEAVRSALPAATFAPTCPGTACSLDGVHTDSATDATAWWRDDLVSVLLGCSFSFEAALMRAGLPVRHIEQNRNVPMYITDQQCEPAGEFEGPLVVSMRPMPSDMVDQARWITEAYPQAHGGPVHAGDPAGLGISDLNAPDFGDSVDIHDDEVPVFWACGVTPQVALANAAPDLAIVHEPGHMFITDLPADPIFR